jgi:flagellar biogenesis protein FliO
MRSWIFLGVSVLITFLLLQQSDKLGDAMLFLEDFGMPSDADLATYASQIFYYFALLVGLIHVVKRFKERQKKKMEAEKQEDKES